jgi:hypothetical protein
MPSQINCDAIRITSDSTSPTVDLEGYDLVVVGLKFNPTTTTNIQRCMHELKKRGSYSRAVYTIQVIHAATFQKEGEDYQASTIIGYSRKRIYA